MAEFPPGHLQEVFPRTGHSEGILFGVGITDFCLDRLRRRNLWDIHDSPTYPSFLQVFIEPELWARRCQALG